MTPVTAHFDLSEFACRSGAPYPITNIDDDGREWLETRLLPLCIVLETLRTKLGGHRINITSGYRTEIYNKRIGGASRSQHCEGRAADIEVDGYAPSDVHSALLKLSDDNQIYIGGLGLYEGWTHVDIRPWIGHVAMWIGAAIGSEK